MDFSKTVLVSDMDGTLLKSDKTLNPIDVEAIKRFCSKGGHFVLATGRPLHTVTDYTGYFEPEPIILCNGGVIYDICKEKTLYEVDLPEAARDVLKKIRERYRDVSPEIYTFSYRYYFHLNTVEKWHQSLLGIDFIRIDSPEETAEPWNKMLFADEIEVIDDMSEYVKSFKNCGLRFVRSFPKFLEVLPEGVSKGSALDELIKIMGWQDKTVAAAGDYDNDLEMLKRADISFCPSNSQDCVKAACTNVLSRTSDEGAIAEAIGILEKI